MLPDPSFWLDHYHAEAGRHFGYILDLARIRREYEAPEVEFHRAMQGHGGGEEFSQGDQSDVAGSAVNRAVDEGQYAQAVSICSFLLKDEETNFRVLLLRMFVLSTWSEYTRRPVMLEQCLADLEKIIKLPRSHAVFYHRPRSQYTKDRARLLKTLTDLRDLRAFEVDKIREICGEAIIYKRTLLRAAIRRVVDWETVYHLAFDPELNSLRIHPDGSLCFTLPLDHSPAAFAFVAPSSVTMSSEPFTAAPRPTGYNDPLHYTPPVGSGSGSWGSEPEQESHVAAPSPHTPSFIDRVSRAIRTANSKTRVFSSFFCKRPMSSSLPMTTLALNSPPKGETCINGAPDSQSCSCSPGPATQHPDGVLAVGALEYGAPYLQVGVGRHRTSLGKGITRGERCGK